MFTLFCNTQSGVTSIYFDTYIQFRHRPHGPRVGGLIQEGNLFYRENFQKHATN